MQNAKIAALLRKHILRFKINLSESTMRKHLTVGLLDCATNVRKHRARVRPNHPYHAHNNHEDHRQHDRVLSDILSLCIPAKILQVLTANSLHANRCYCLKKWTETKWPEGGGTKVPSSFVGLPTDSLSRGQGRFGDPFSA